MVAKYITHEFSATIFCSNEDAKLFICDNGSSPILPLPAISSGDFLLLHTSPQVLIHAHPAIHKWLDLKKIIYSQLAMSGSFRLFLLGELSKLGVISPAR